MCPLSIPWRKGRVPNLCRVILMPRVEWPQRIRSLLLGCRARTCMDEGAVQGPARRCPAGVKPFPFSPGTNWGGFGLAPSPVPTIGLPPWGVAKGMGGSLPPTPPPYLLVHLSLVVWGPTVAPLCCPPLPCPALLCPAPPCFALPRLALPCPALLCLAVRGAMMSGFHGGKGRFEIMGQAGVFPAIYPNGAKMALGWQTGGNCFEAQKSFSFRRERIWVDSACLEM